MHKSSPYHKYKQPEIYNKPSEKFLSESIKRFLVSQPSAYKRIKETWNPRISFCHFKFYLLRRVDEFS